MIGGIGVLRCTPAEVADIVRNFGGPDEVALIERHHGRVVGWLQAILPVESDLWFLANVTDPATADRLLRGRVEVSMEVEVRGMAALDPAEALGLLRRAAAGDPGVVIRLTDPTPVVSQHFRGRIGAGAGWCLTSIALLQAGEPPARPGSALWVPA